ncbi:hypothetical protein QQZ08_000996 [Neonectria magnoliae]|uniref:Uncharacterized protein n=1 Tax=Neonectria magnoliae TaxID=2732573 RepID=A0ABR1IFN5_9HYPO
MPPRIGRRREGFVGFLERAGNTKDGTPHPELVEIDEPTKEIDEAARGFRHHPLSVRMEQDNDLALYQKWVRSTFEEANDEASLDRICFPDPGTGYRAFEKLFSQLRRFFVFTTLTCLPGPDEDDTTLRPMLEQFRRSFLFWIDRKYIEREIHPPAQGEVQASLDEIVRYLYHHHKIRVARVKPETLIGPRGLLQMMDFDIRETRCIELAECHHLAWVFGRMAALKPSSLGPPKNVDPEFEFPYLMWRDLEIERSSVVGKFSVKVAIRNLETNSIDPERQYQNKQLSLWFESPTAGRNLELSIPHRILTIALRRGVLWEIQTIDELLHGSKRFITFKPEFLNKPVLVAGKNGEWDVDLHEPMQAEALSNYLKLRAEKVGITGRVCLPSFRKDPTTAISENFDVVPPMISEFNRRVLAQAKQYVADTQPSNLDTVEQEIQTAGVDLDNAFGEGFVIESNDQDVDDQSRGNIERGEETQTVPDEATKSTEELGKMDYTTVVRCAMEVWLLFGTGTSRFDKTTPCPSCQNDETVDSETKSKRYDLNELDRHLSREFHSKFEQFARRAQIVAKRKGLATVQCEICAAIAPSRAVIPAYDTIETLERHVTYSNLIQIRAIEPLDDWWNDERATEHSTVEQFEIAHEVLKRAMGWYEKDFRGKVEHKKRRRTMDSE